MNSGKYLYSASAVKKVPNPKKINVSLLQYIILKNIFIKLLLQKPQLKYITNETINHFKKFISRLHKKEEEALLNKKKKREETKQKNKIEKVKMNNMNNPTHYYNYPPNMYMSPMQINNQNPAFYNEYQNLYYINPQSYQINPQMLSPYFSPYMMPMNSLQDSLNNIYKRGIVNNIIAAFFIKECKDNNRNNEKRKVPVSTVELNDDQGDNNTENNENLNDENQDNKNNNNNNNFGNNGGENEEKNLEEKNEEKKDNNEDVNDDNKNKNNHHENELIKPSIL